MRPFLLLYALLLLPGCTNLSQLRKVNPQADNFSSALAAEYLAYAESEEEQNHFFSADYYAGKGLKAAAGEEVLPDEPDSSLPDEEEEEVRAAYKDLMGLLTEDVKRARPQELARLQLLFDCWQQQAMDNGMNKGRINREPDDTSCADEFKPAVIELQNVAQQLLYSQVKYYKLSFRYNSERLTSISRNRLNDVVRNVARLKDFIIVVQAGSATGAKQRALQARRLDAVYSLLVNAGIPEARIRRYSEGDSKRVSLSEDTNKPMIVGEKMVVVIVKTPKK